MSDFAPTPAHLIAADSADAEVAEESLAVAASSAHRLQEHTTSGFARQLSYWRRHGCPQARQLEALAYDTPEAALALIKPLCRLSDRPMTPTRCGEAAIRMLRTSGSSGVPFEYGISREWRLAHHAAWRLGYRHMTSGRLKGYLDPAFQWLMARPPGAAADNFAHTIECHPTPNGLSFSHALDQCWPLVIHGSVTTMIELLEYNEPWRWMPEIVVFGYESHASWQVEQLRRAWPHAQYHNEYASNDGGAAGFTCPGGALHMWTARSVMRFADGPLRVADLYNHATSFVGYECGDEVTWQPGACPCGLALPAAQMVGRQSGTIRLRNGAALSTLCPFSSTQLRGVRAIRVVICKGDCAEVHIVPDPDVQVDLPSLQATLAGYGVAEVRVHWHQSVSKLRSRWGKFKTVVDYRTPDDRL